MDTKKYYRCIMLVIASNDNIVYKNARSVWKKYMNINSMKLNKNQLDTYYVVTKKLRRFSMKRSLLKFFDIEVVVT